MADGPGGAKAAALVADPSDEDVSTQVYLGVVKSYNDRRGFGFLACEETADRYGRDVYMPKAEATMAALQAVGVERETAAAMVLSGSTSASATAAATAAAASGKSPAQAAAAAAVAAEKEKLDAGSAGEKAPPAPRLAEEDLVLFRVRLSVEGYPQAVCVQRLKKLSGTVQRPTAFPAPGARRSDAAAEGVGLIHSEAAGSLLGSPTVSFQRLACGQVRLMPGDVVTFCLPQAAAGVDGAGGALAAAMTAANAAEAKNISLVKTDRASGSVLGCFTLDLPRTGGEAPSSAPNLQLTCHGFGDKLILAGLPPDLDDTELMRFFSKQGASGTIVAHARACSFASVSFQATADVARLLGRTAHAFADDKDTLIARLLDLAPGTELTATLPALPAPALSAGGYPNEADTLEPGSLLVVWSPLVLAVAYSAELRPAGSNGPWAAVDVASNRLGASSNRFDSNCSSCKVTGLVLNSAYEARISYFTECGTCSEASEASTPCMPAASVNHGASTAGPPIAPMLQAAAPAGYTQTLPAAGFPAAGSGTSPAIFLGPQAGLGAAEGFGSHALNVSMPPPFAAPGDPRHLSFGAPPPQAVAPLGMPPAPPAWPAWGGPVADPYANKGLLPPMPPVMPLQDPAAGLGGYGLAPPSWRSPSGLVVPAPAAPELRPGDEFGFAVSVQWPAVLQAAAYVVELREAGSVALERFVRSAPEAKLGTLVELRVGGLRPGPPPGRVYMAQVRTIGADGSESAPSQPGWSPPLPALDPGAQPSAAPSDARLLSTPGVAFPPSAAASPCALSADAAEWVPSAQLLETKPESWLPPPWLSPSKEQLLSPPPITPPQRLPLPENQTPSALQGMPDMPWGSLGIPPPPLAGPPALRGGGPAEEAEKGPGACGASQGECLILD